MDIHIGLTGRGDLTAQIYRQIFEAMLDGRLRNGERLPATRSLANRLNVARNTVAVAYERLVAEGVAVGRVGAGTFVAATLPRQRPVRIAPSEGVKPLELWQSILARAPRRPCAPPVEFDFSVGSPDPALFPYSEWRRLIGQELRSISPQHQSSPRSGGHAGLRAAIARHVSVSRAVRAEARDVIVTQGAQQAFDLIGRILIAAGTSVAVEDPGYPNARLLFQSLGARVIGVPVDHEGIDVSAIPKRARIVYVTPSHQFPLGHVMSLRRRTALLAWAGRSRAAIIEDDYDSEFRFAGRPLDPLQSLDRTGRVIYVGSFSKVLMPSLRRGFLIAPQSLQPALFAAKQLTDLNSEATTMGALARFIEDGLLARHIRNVSREYEMRYQQLAASLQRHLGRHLRLLPAAAGLHVAAAALRSSTTDIAKAVRIAEHQGVRVQSLADFYANKPTQTGMVLGFGRIPAARIDEGVRRLAAGFAPTQR
jgi:GntR family transcriptional regulator/MocR family aminotransferase